MRAVIRKTYGEADQVIEVVDDFPKPTAGPKEVLVRVHAAGVDPGAWHIMAGLPKLCRLVFGIFKPRNHQLGLDLSGVVESVGEKVTKFKPGDEVFGVADMGSFAEFAVAKEELLQIKPAFLSFEEAAAAPISGLTAICAMQAAKNLKEGDHVAVVGAAGGVGSYVTQLAKAKGFKVTGICSTGKVDLVKSLGADNVIDYKKEDFTKSEQQFDAIIDTAGCRSFHDMRTVLAPKGSLVIVGGEGEGDWVGDLGRTMGAGIYSIFSSQTLTGIMSLCNEKDLITLREYLESRQMKPLVGSKYPLDQAREAINYIHSGHAKGKVVLTI